MALCHNVTPIIENGERVLQASSPDEIALVTIASEMGITLMKRNQTKITLEVCTGKKLEYEILANFPFSSKTKRMGILLKDLQNNKIIFYLKGADTVMQLKVNNVIASSFIQEECENLSLEGLRTLVITSKEIKE